MLVIIMKKKYLFVLALVALVFTSCQKRFEPINYEEGSYTYTITATVPETDTKSDYDGAGKFTWTSGDQISVLFHKESENKFFTLKTTGSGKTAIFNGTIEAGYTIGASDGTGEDKKIWALFPASENHTYTEGSRPKFYIPAELDLTSRFTADLPMYALNTAEGAFNFGNLACSYKFTVTNIDASKAPKIRAVVYNQKDAALSGLITMSSGPYLRLSDGEGSRQRSFICNVEYDSDPTKGTAVFYVTTRYAQSYFKPEIQINNYSTDSPIKTFTATVAPAALNKGDVKPITLDVADGEYFVPAITIDGSFSDWSAVGGTETPSDICKVMKATSDKYYYYLYLVSDATKRALTEVYEFDSGYYYLDFDLDNDPATGSYTENSNGNFEAYTYMRLFKSDGTTISFNENPYVSTSNGVSSAGVVAKGVVDAGLMHIEIKIPRGNLPSVSSGQTIRILSWRSKGGSVIEYSFEVA